MDCHGFISWSRWCGRELRWPEEVEGVIKVVVGKLRCDNCSLWCHGRVVKVVGEGLGSC